MHPAMLTSVKLSIIGIICELYFLCRNPVLHFTNKLGCCGMLMAMMRKALCDIISFASIA